MDKQSTPLNWDDKVRFCQQWQASGLSIREFCKQKEISVSTFKGWRKRLWPSQHKSKLYGVQITNLQGGAVVVSGVNAVAF